MSDRAAAASRQWRRERPDLEPLPMELLGRMRELAHRIERDTIGPLFARFGLQAGEFDVLATLYRTGASYSLTPTELYETLMISSGGMTNRLDRLEKAGLITRCPHPRDRRGTLVSLSTQGKALIDGMLEAHVANCCRALAPLTPTEQETLNALLTKLVTGLGQEAASL